MRSLGAAVYHAVLLDLPFNPSDSSVLLTVARLNFRYSSEVFEYHYSSMDHVFMLCHLQEKYILIIICPFLDLGFCGQSLLMAKLPELSTGHSITDASKHPESR